MVRINQCRGSELEKWVNDLKKKIAKNDPDFSLETIANDMSAELCNVFVDYNLTVLNKENSFKSFAEYYADRINTGHHFVVVRNYDGFFETMDHTDSSKPRRAVLLNEFNDKNGFRKKISNLYRPPKK